MRRVRMLKQSLAVLAMVFIVVPRASGYETLNTVFVDGAAAMVMDGNLDDWANIPAQEVPVTHSVDKTRDDAEVISTHGESDCKFSFKCFADRDYVYFALIVKDDIVLVGRHIYGKGWLDDSNTLYFDGDCIDIDKEFYDANDGQLKVIGNPPNGVKYIEGYVPYFYEGNFPCFWEARGVKSGFRVTEDGYITEIAIPVSLLGWDGITAGKVMGANLRVVDKDGDVDDESTDKGYIWAPDPDHTAHFSAKSYNRISFDIVIPSPESSPKNTQLVQTDDGILVQLGMPDMTKGEAILKTVLAELQNSDFATAKETLLPFQDELWVKPILGCIELKKGDIIAGTNMLIDFGEECPYDWGVDYIKNFFNESIGGFLQSYQGESIVLTDDFVNDMLTILKIYTDRMPDEENGLLLYSNYLEHAHQYGQALENYSKIETTSKNEDIVLESLVRKAVIYSKIGEEEKAIILARLLLNQGLCCDNQSLMKSLIYDYYINH